MKSLLVRRGLGTNGIHWSNLEDRQLFRKRSPSASGTTRNCAGKDLSYLRKKRHFLNRGREKRKGIKVESLPFQFHDLDQKGDLGRSAG